jgi:hypothetical protein
VLFLFEHDGHDESAIRVVEMDVLIRMTSCDTNNRIRNIYHEEVHFPQDLFLRLLAIMASSQHLNSMELINDAARGGRRTGVPAA